MMLRAKVTIEESVGGASGRNCAMRSNVIASTTVPARLSGQHRHSLDIPGHRDQGPLTLNRSQPAQQKLPKAHRRFDDAKHWFYGLFAQPVELAAGAGLQPMLHALHGAGRLAQRRRMAQTG